MTNFQLQEVEPSSFMPVFDGMAVSDVRRGISVPVFDDMAVADARQAGDCVLRNGEYPTTILFKADLKPKILCQHDQRNVELVVWSINKAGVTTVNPVRYQAPRELRRLQASTDDGTEKCSLVVFKNTDCLVAANWRFLVVGDGQAMHLLDFLDVEPPKLGTASPWRAVGRT